MQSQAQMKYLYAKHPEIAARWQKEAPVNYKELPEHKKKKRGTGMLGSKT